MTIILWLIGCLIVGAIGSNRKIGFFMSFLFSLLLSPIIGLIITLFSESNSSIEMRKQSLELQQQQNHLLSQIRNDSNSKDFLSELEKLNNLKESGAITEEEFIKAKQRLLD